MACANKIDKRLLYEKSEQKISKYNYIIIFLSFDYLYSYNKLTGTIKFVLTGSVKFTKCDLKYSSIQRKIINLNSKKCVKYDLLFL